MDKNMWPEKVLFVDDEPNVLSGFKRQLRKGFNMDTAIGGEAGLEEIRRLQPGNAYAVVVSDMRMPKMDGVQFLKKVMAESPDTVRMVLTGFADQTAAIKAVNEGNVFRFLTKPCPAEILSGALRAGIEQYRLITAERELLEKTLKGSITVLTDILSLTDPLAFERATKLKTYLGKLSNQLEIENIWELESAAMLSPIGFVTLPEEIRVKVHNGETLSDQERGMIGDVSKIGKRLIDKIPRLESVAELVEYDRIDPAKAPDPIAPKIRILRVLSKLIDLEISGKSPTEALGELHNDDSFFDDRALIERVKAALGLDKEEVDETVAVLELKLADVLAGDLLKSDLLTEDNRLLLSAGATITEPVIERLNNYLRLVGIVEPIIIARDTNG